jgi:hypothetical protein
MEKAFPRSGLSTATQQYVLLSGMAGYVRFRNRDIKA